MSDENGLTIHVLHCGTITIPREMAYRTGHRTRERVTLPVSVYLIEHPVHGRILIDTGLSADCRDIFPQHLLSFYDPHIEKGQTAAEQLAGLGLRPEDIDVLIITHNDIDHTCAVRDFAGKAKRIVMPELEYFYSARVVFKLRQSWDTYMPFIDGIERKYFYGCAQGPLGRGFDLFGDDSLLCISCSGHTDGQIAIMLNKSPSGRFANAGAGMYGGPFVLFAADAAFSVKNIEDQVIPGYGFDHKMQLKSLRWLAKVKEDRNCRAILCSHDAGVEPQVIRI